MRRNEKTVRLFETACRVGEELGIEVEDAAADGSSDGCFCAALGVPVLDVSEPWGPGRAEDEHVVLSSMSERASLISAILTRL
jgi:glutamate carboxypeptidase